MYKKLPLLILITLLSLSCEQASQRSGEAYKQELAGVQQEQNTVTRKKKKEKKETLSFKKGEEYSVRVVAIADGDTFTGLTSDDLQVKCRVYGIDAPEKKQAFGNRSRQTLSELIFEDQVKIKIQKKDPWGRAVVWVYDSEGNDIAAEMLAAGMAWHFKKYDNTKKYADLENTARKNRVGLWQEKSPTPPWEFRKN